jgi:hypothetical protein
MRTTFSEIHLFNDNFSVHDTFLYSTEKGGQRAKQWRDRDRMRERGRVLRQKGYGVGNKLDCWTNIYGS